MTLVEFFLVVDPKNYNFISQRCLRHLQGLCHSFVDWFLKCLNLGTDSSLTCCGWPRVIEFLFGHTHRLCSWPTLALHPLLFWSEILLGGDSCSLFTLLAAYMFWYFLVPLTCLPTPVSLGSVTNISVSPTWSLRCHGNGGALVLLLCLSLSPACLP